MVDAKVFDVFRGGPVPAGKRSVAFALTFQSPDRTLGPEDVAKAREQIIARVRNEFKAELRN